MNLILVSGRYAEPETHHAADAEFARALAKSGCSVRWIVPAAPGGVRRNVQGVRVISVESRVPGFAAVVERLRDHRSEAGLNRAIREEMPDLVHVLDYGGAISINLMWISDRMGVPAIVSARAAPTLCHRGDLRYKNGPTCEEFLSPERCADCCLTPAENGLSRMGSLCGRLLGALRAPICPFPSTLAFADRLELVAGGLQSAVRIVVVSALDRDRLAAMGVPGELIVVAAPASAEEWRRLYGGVVRNGAVAR